MAQDVAQLTILCAATAAINTANAAKEGKDIVTPLVAAGVGFAALSFAGQLWRWDLVNAVAGIFLLAAFINRGLPLISGAVAIAQGGKTSKASNTQAKGWAGGGGSF